MNHKKDEEEELRSRIPDLINNIPNELNLDKATLHKSYSQHYLKSKCFKELSDICVVLLWLPEEYAKKTRLEEEAEQTNHNIHTLVKMVQTRNCSSKKKTAHAGFSY